LNDLYNKKRNKSEIIHLIRKKKRIFLLKNYKKGKSEKDSSRSDSFDVDGGWSTGRYGC
jgi:hypothetical protein